MLDLTNKVALVTGAKQGMGRTHALALAKQGAKVVVTDIDESQCVPVVLEIKEMGGEAVCFKMDVSDLEEIGHVFDEVIKKFGRLDILVNNAGIFIPKPALDITEEEWNKMIDINLKGQFFCAQRAGKEMAKNKWGRIINISSIASGQVGVGFLGAAHYSATKGGILAMTETLAQEFASLGINVNAVAPGAIDTPMISGSGMDDSEMKAVLARVPLKRMGKPEEVSAMVVFLASDEASYITGATFYVDGGWLAV